MVPFICIECGTVEKYATVFSSKKRCECGGKMLIDYQDNYKKDTVITVCDTCTYNRIGTGSKCSYCVHM